MGSAGQDGGRIISKGVEVGAFHSHMVLRVVGKHGGEWRARTCHRSRCGPNAVLSRGCVGRAPSGGVHQTGAWRREAGLFLSRPAGSMVGAQGPLPVAGIPPKGGGVLSAGITLPKSIHPAYCPIRQEAGSWVRRQQLYLSLPHAGCSRPGAPAGMGVPAQVTFTK